MTSPEIAVGTYLRMMYKGEYEYSQLIEIEHYGQKISALQMTTRDKIPSGVEIVDAKWGKGKVLLRKKNQESIDTN